jgi:SAM-dependent methyltransferase
MLEMLEKPSLEQIKNYYDSDPLLSRKIRDFVDGNARIERAWETLESWAPAKPGRILEIACAIGGVCWRLSQRWPNAEVIGMDISDKSLEIAQTLFDSGRPSFLSGPFPRVKPPGKFDLIILMDVYEHIDPDDRRGVHEGLGEKRSEKGRIILSFPTPRHLKWLKENHDKEIQPIDEHITIETISTLAKETATEVLFYREVGIWHEGDYAHAVLGRQTDWVPVPPTHPSRRTTLIKSLFGKGRSGYSTKAERRRLVHSRLGKDAYP